MFAATRRFRATTPRHLAWLLWLALLLPLAQTAASSHVYSHTASDDTTSRAAADAHGKHASGILHCDLSLAGTLLHGGALPGVPPGLDLHHPNQAAPDAAFDSLCEAAPALAYQGRAPPFALS